MAHFIYQIVVFDKKNGHWSWPDHLHLFITNDDFVCKQLSVSIRIIYY